MKKPILILFIIILLGSACCLKQPIIAKHRNKCVVKDTSVKHCLSSHSIIHNDSSSQLIKRNTIKSVLDVETKDKLMALSTIFVPSAMYGTSCNQIYTTYYDFLKTTYSRSVYNFLKTKRVKRVRIRHYYFDPNSYFEIKYSQNKIRVLIDCDYNILEPIHPEYEEVFTVLLDKIKTREIPVLFFNEYKRFSFVYKSDQNIRMTIDTDNKIKYLEVYHEMPFDILEIKYNINIPTNVIYSYFNEIEMKIGDPIILGNFSKSDYTAEKVIIPYRKKHFIPPTPISFEDNYKPLDELQNVF
jgi:hypothetical protein